jgi:hypothetical protein
VAWWVHVVHTYRSHCRASFAYFAHRSDVLTWRVPKAVPMPRKRKLVLAIKTMKMKR